MQSPYNGYHPTATCLAMRLLTLWQRRARQKSKWIDPPATLRWRPSSRPSNTASGGTSTHGTTRLTPYYLLTRREQVTVFRLRTGHNRLNYHLYSKLCIGHTEQCPCGTGSQTTEHLLQSCPTYGPLRKGIWPDHTPVARKLYGSLRYLRCTATFIEETGVSIWRTRRRRRLTKLEKKSNTNYNHVRHKEYKMWK